MITPIPKTTDPHTYEIQHMFRPCQGYETTSDGLTRYAGEAKFDESVEYCLFRTRTSATHQMRFVCTQTGEIVKHVNLNARRRAAAESGQRVSRLV